MKANLTLPEQPLLLFVYNKYYTITINERYFVNEVPFFFLDG